MFGKIKKLVHSSVKQMPQQNHSADLGGETATKPSNPVYNQTAVKASTSLIEKFKAASKTTKLISFGVGAFLLLTILAVIGGSTGNTNTSAQNVTSATSAAQREKKDEKKLQRAYKQAKSELARAKEIYASSEGNVADETTRTELKTQIEKLEKLVQSKSKNTSYAALNTSINALTRASTAVEKSQDDKAYNDAAAAAQPILDQANATYVQSEGKMENDAYRATLLDKITALQNVINTSGTSSDQITQAAQAASTAIDDVNKNIEYKQQLDAQAAAQAAQAAQEAQQQAQAAQAAQQQAQAPASAYYANCSAARAAGAAPLYQGQPGYESRLDRDHDGVACE